MTDVNGDWDLGFVMPNLQLASPYEFEQIAFVPANDSRVVEISSRNKAAGMLLQGFSDQGGQSVQPTAIIFTSKNSFKYLWGAIVDARNCLALSCILNAWQLSIGYPNNFLIRDADYFDFYPRWPSTDGKHLVYEGPALHLVSTVGRTFNAQPHAYIGRCHPQMCHASPDETVLTNLFNVWKRVHKCGKARPADRRILRSLSVAYEASRVPQTMDNPLYDHGKHCSMWVSALETLAHPSRGQVFQKTVLELLGRRKLGDRRVGAKRRVRIWKQKVPLNLVQRLCVLLYKARNAFLHGNALRMKVFIPPRMAKGIRLLDVAPLLYLTGLEGTFGPPCKRKVHYATRQEQRLADIFDIMSHNTLEHAFSRSVGWRNKFGLST